MSTKWEGLHLTDWDTKVVGKEPLEKLHPRFVGSPSPTWASAPLALPPSDCGFRVKALCIRHVDIHHFSWEASTLSDQQHSWWFLMTICNHRARPCCCASLTVFWRKKNNNKASFDLFNYLQVNLIYSLVCHKRKIQHHFPIRKKWDIRRAANLFRPYPAVVWVFLEF